MAVPETRPNHTNHTIYINNLNEKIKKDGEFQGCLGVVHEAAPLPQPCSWPSDPRAVRE